MLGEDAIDLFHRLRQTSRVGGIGAKRAGGLAGRGECVWLSMCSQPGTAARVFQSRACQPDDGSTLTAGRRRELWRGAVLGQAPLQRLDDRQLAIQDFSLRFLS